MKKILLLFLFAKIFAEWLPFSDHQAMSVLDSQLKKELDLIYRSNIYFEIYSVQSRVLSGQLKTNVFKEKLIFNDIGIILLNGAILAASNANKIEKTNQLQLEPQLEPSMSITLKVNDVWMDKETRFVAINNIDLYTFESSENKSYLYISSKDESDKLHEIISDRLSGVYPSSDAENILLNRDKLQSILKFKIVNHTRQNISYQSQENNTIILVDPQAKLYKIETLKKASTLYYKPLDGSLIINETQFDYKDERYDRDNNHSARAEYNPVKHLSVYICSTSDTDIKCMFVGFTDNKHQGFIYTIYTPLKINDDLVKITYKPNAQTGTI